MHKVLKEYLDNNEALDAEVSSKTTYLSVEDVEIIIDRVQRGQNELLVIKEIAELRVEKRYGKYDYGFRTNTCGHCRYTWFLYYDEYSVEMHNSKYCPNCGAKLGEAIYLEDDSN